MIDVDVTQIPREHLISMLADAVWFSGNRDVYKRQGYSLDVSEGASIRDVNYRNKPLYDTPLAAIVAHWKRHYQNT